MSNLQQQNCKQQKMPKWRQTQATGNGKATKENAKVSTSKE
jgi:hypothetical protein